MWQKIHKGGEVGLRNEYEFGLLLLLSFMLIIPIFFPKYYVFILAVTLCYAIYAIGYNLLFGYTGLLSFGHALYWGVGAYTVAALMSPELGPYRIYSMELLILLSVITSGLVAFAVGSICVRYTRIFFGLLNLGFVMLWYSMLLKLYSITGGTDGLPVYIPTLLGQKFSPEVFRTFTYYYYVLAVFIITTFVMWRVINSHFGLTLKGLRENSLRSGFVGVNISKYRLASYLLSGIWGGIGGALWAPLSGQVSPEISTWLTSGDVVFMAILGGVGTFLGPIIGALIFFNLKVQIMHYTTYWQLFLGSAVIFMVLVFPGGIVGALSGLRSKKRERLT
jgi:branched-chain amino acid transport system permease protein